MFSEKCFNDLTKDNEPEILRINLRNVILGLKAIGVEKIFDFDFLDKPNTDKFAKAYEELMIFGALDSESKLTDEGRLMSILPVEPIYAKILLSTLDKEFIAVQDEVLTIISVLQTDNIYYTPSNFKEKAEKIRERFTNPSSDHLTLLNIYNQWQENIRNDKIWAKENFVNEKSLRKARDVKAQIKKYLVGIERGKRLKEGGNKDEIFEDMAKRLEELEERNKLLETSKKEEMIIQCLLKGYFLNIAKYSSDNLFITLVIKS